MALDPAVISAYRAPMQRLIVAAAVKSAQLYPTEEAFQAHCEAVRLRRELEARRVMYQPDADATMYGGRLAEAEALGMVTNH